MMRVYKYPAPLSAESLLIDLPTKAKVLTVQIQHGQPKIWALVDDDDSVAPRTFRWVGFEHAPLDGLGAYVGSVQFQRGDLVFHLFEVQP